MSADDIKEFEGLLPSEIIVILADRCRALREIKGKNQKEFSKFVGIPYGTYQKFEQEGKISLERFVQIVSALGRRRELETFLNLDDVQKLGIETFKKVHGLKTDNYS